MSNLAFGAVETRALDPAVDTHYIISEDVQHSLGQLCDALIALGQLAEVPRDEIGPFVEVRYLSALFHMLSAHGQHLIAAAIPRFPSREAKEAAELAVAEAVLAKLKGGLQ